MNPPNEPSLFDYCSTLDEMIRSGRTQGRTGQVFDHLSALSTVNNLVVLRALMQELKPTRSLEIGLSFGGSALAISATHRDLGHTPSGQHVALDPFQARVWDDSGLVALDREGLSGYVDFRSAFSSLELPKLLLDDLRFGLIYVDGSHVFEDVFVDAYFCMRLLEIGGVVVFDDSADPSVAKVLRFIRRNLGGSMIEVDVGSYRPDLGKSLKYKIAGLIGRRQLTAFKRVGEVVRSWDAPLQRF